MICGAHWGTTKLHDAVLAKGFARLAAKDERTAGLSVWLSLRRYPALVLFYGMGLAAVANNNYRLLKCLVETKIPTQMDQEYPPAVAVVHHFDTLDLDAQKALPGYERQHTPLSNHLFEILRDPLREYMPDDHVFDRTFDWLEYLLGLLYCDAKTTLEDLQKMKQQNPDVVLWGPVGRFAWKSAFGTRSVMQEAEIREGQRVSERVGAMLAAGFFDSTEGHSGKYQAVKSGFDRHVHMVRSQWRVFS